VRAPSAAAYLRALLLALLAAAWGCGSGGVDANRLEKAVATTFANLVHLQEERLELPPVQAASLRATASCRKVASGPNDRSSATGGGNWVCTLAWFVPGRKASLHDTYDLAVTVDGCYTATTDAAEGHVGGPTLTTRSGATVTNLLYVFDGCFDTT
jgi:hypothetical protein